jgi:ssDNA-binding Zn-finger/Zn-ribbon topoisomerase 1
MKPSSIVDHDNPSNNMYGCSDCPKCGSKFRWARSTKASDMDVLKQKTLLVIVCDDCGLEERGFPLLK